MICVEAGNWGLRLEGLERLKGLEGLEGLEILRGLGKGYVTGFIVLKVLNKTLTHN